MKGLEKRKGMPVSKHENCLPQSLLNYTRNPNFNNNKKYRAYENARKNNMLPIDKAIGRTRLNYDTDGETS